MYEIYVRVVWVFIYGCAWVCMGVYGCVWVDPSAVLRQETKEGGEEEAAMPHFDFGFRIPICLV